MAQVEETRPRVVLADDHPPMRFVVRTMLAQAGYDVLIDVASGDEAVRAADAEHPDVCILDVRMPGDGIVAAEQIMEISPDTAVVMLTASLDDLTLIRSWRAGVRGVLAKDTDVVRLPEALAEVLAGDRPLPRALTRRIAERLLESEADNADAAPALPRELLRLLAAGVTLAEAAATTGLSQESVRQAITEVATDR